MKNISVKNWVDFFSVRLQLDAGYFFRGGFWGSIQQSVGLITGLLVSYLFGHFTNKQVFGEYNLILSYISLLTFFSLPGLDTAIVSAVSTGFDGSFAVSIKQKLKFSLLGSAVLLLFAFYNFLYQEPNIAFILFIAALCFPFLNAFSIYPAFLTGKRRFKELSLLLSSGSLVFLISHVLSISLFNTALGLVVAYMFARIVSDVFGVLYARRYLQNNRVDPDVLPYGSFLTTVNILPWISGHIGNIVLASLLGVESLAIFAVANRFLSAFQKNFFVFYKPVTAKLSSQSPEEHLQVLKQHAPKLILMGISLASILFVCTPFLIQFFFTTNYQDAISYGRILSFTFIPLPLTWVLADILIYQKRRRTQVVISVLPHVIKIILYFLLIPHFKIYALVYIALIERFTDPIIPLWSILKHSRKTRA